MKLLIWVTLEVEIDTDVDDPFELDPDEVEHAAKKDGHLIGWEEGTK